MPRQYNNLLYTTKKKNQSFGMFLRSYQTKVMSYEAFMMIEHTEKSGKVEQTKDYHVYRSTELSYAVSSNNVN